MKLYDTYDMSLDEWRRNPIDIESMRDVSDRERYFHYGDYGIDAPPGWIRQHDGLTALCERWPNGEFLKYLSPLLEMTQAEMQVVHKALNSGDLCGEHSPWGFVTEPEALAAWLADWRCSRRRNGWFERRANMPPLVWEYA